jgi:hypothetical protein
MLNIFFSDGLYFILKNEKNQQVSFTQLTPINSYPNSDEGQALAKG